LASIQSTMMLPGHHIPYQELLDILRSSVLEAQQAALQSQALIRESQRLLRLADKMDAPVLSSNTSH